MIHNSLKFGGGFGPLLSGEKSFPAQARAQETIHLAILVREQRLQFVDSLRGIATRQRDRRTAIGEDDALQ